MDFEQELIKAEVVSRYKRFIVDVKLRDDTIVPAFCSDEIITPNLYIPGAEVWLSKAKNKLRKLRYEVQMINKGDGLVMVNHSYCFYLFFEAFKNKKMPDFIQYTKIRRTTLDDNLPYVEFELSNAQEKCYVSVRSVYNKQDGMAVFPTKVSFVDMEMFEEMKKLRSQGHRTSCLLLVPRQDCYATKFSWTIDPLSAAKVFDEAKNGLEFVSYGCKISKTGISLENKFNIEI